jgi:hypothetical protein
MSTNPAPRPALARTETGLTRPQLKRPDLAPPAPVEPALVVVDEPVTVPARTGGKTKKTKHSHKDSAKNTPKDIETVEVTVTLTKLSRRALKEAAHEREMTPEDLASLVLSAWLDR